LKKNNSREGQKPARVGQKNLAPLWLKSLIRAWKNNIMNEILDA